MSSNSDQQVKIKIPKNGAIQRIKERQAQQRKNNFINIIHKQPLIEFYRTIPSSNDERDSVGIQWFSGITGPSSLCGYPDQDYWEIYSMIVKYTKGD